MPDLTTFDGRYEYGRHLARHGNVEPTADHLTLLERAYWRWSDVEFGAPEIDGKRPYGNSDVEADLAELLPHLDERDRLAVHCELVSVIRSVVAAGIQALRAPNDDAASVKPPAEPTSREVLDLQLPENDAGAATIREYLTRLLAKVWRDEQCFNGKRPFGNSGWQADLYGPMATAGWITGEQDEDGYWDDLDHVAGDRLLQSAIRALGEEPSDV